MRPAVRLQADPLRLAAYGLSLEDVRTAIAAANVDTPKGSVDGPRQASAVMADDQLLQPADFADVVIAWRNGAPVRLRDVGAAVQDLENTLNGAWYNGAPGGADRRAAPARRQYRLDRRRAAGPAADCCRARCRSGRRCRSSPTGRRPSAPRCTTCSSPWCWRWRWWSRVIFVFLRSARATIIPGIALPLSIIGTFGVMALCGFSLDNLSLMALTIATGFVVDDAIVMIENIVRLIEEGKRPLEAAYRGRGADRLHRGVADRLAGRGLHPAAVHAGRGRAAVPGIRAGADHRRASSPWSSR